LVVCVAEIRIVVVDAFARALVLKLFRSGSANVVAPRFLVPSAKLLPLPPGAAAAGIVKCAIYPDSKSDATITPTAKTNQIITASSDKRFNDNRDRDGNGREDRDLFHVEFFHRPPSNLVDL